MQLSRKGWTHFLWLWLTLAAIFTHALLPLGPSLARQSGSAFSAQTSDVAISRSSRPQVQKSKAQPRAAPEERDLGNGSILGNSPDPAIFVGASVPLSFPPTMAPPPVPAAASNIIGEACCRLANPPRAPPAV